MYWYAAVKNRETIPPINGDEAGKTVSPAIVCVNHYEFEKGIMR